MTEFRGRGDSIEVFPLSFKEYLSAFDKGKEDVFNDYLLYGGLPYTLTLATHEEKAAYLSSLFTEIYFKDIEERYSIEKEYVLEALVDSIYSSVGSLSNIKRLADSINSSLSLKAGSQVSNNTIASYLSYAEDAFLLSAARRYDVRGKKYFESQKKYYATDLGLRNARLNFRQIEQPHLMENAIYIYLKQKGFLVDVGVIEKSRVNENGKSERVKYGIDFAVNKGMYQYYIQSAYSLESDEKKRKELYPFSITGNSFKKIVVTRHELMPHYDENGIFHIGIEDFLLGDYLSG